MTAPSAKPSFVYILKNKINNKVYIGKTNNPSERKTRHFSTAKTGNAKNGKYQVVHKAIKKYGRDNFSFKILEECENEEKAFEREKIWIIEYNATDKKFGYNLTDGGLGGKIVSEEIKQKISEKLKGRKQDPEIIKKRVRNLKLSKMSLQSILRDLHKILLFIPEYKIKRSRKNIEDECKDIFNNFIKNKEIKYNLKDPNKKLIKELKEDIIYLYKNNNFTIKILSKLFNVKEKSVKYIINRYSKYGVPTEEQKYINRSNAHKGKKHSQEHKNKISCKSKGRKHTEATKQKLSKDRTGEGNPMFGKPHSNETKAKLSEFQSTRERKPLTEEHKKILSEKSKTQDPKFRISQNIKDEIFAMYLSCNYTKKQIAEKFGLKLNSVIKIIRVASKKTKPQ